ncbi:MAG: CCA tRNA nucleotidyltransferase [bacterium]
MNLLKEIKAVASGNNIPVYLVGGIVRDKLLGKKTDNPDITVEGDGITFAKLLQKKLGGKLIVHPDFGTATLIFKTGKLDIATCREEKYSAPAKLPIVKNSTLLKDLKRRDFTINTMALDLQTNKLIDPFNGQQDLKLKLIRILHDKSFEDDPTRIFRAFRFAGRLGFKPEKETAELIREAISGGFIQKLTPERIKNEIVLILKEPKRYEIIKFMNEFKPILLKHIGLKMPDKKLFDAITANLKLPCFNKEIKNDWFVYFCALIDYKKLPTLIKLTKEELSILKQIDLLLSGISKLKKAKLPSEIYKQLHSMQEESLLFVISAVPSVKSKILKFLTVYNKVRINITGKELAKLGIKSGPLYAELLSSILYGKLDGKIRTKADEIRFLKSRKLPQLKGKN